MTPLRALLVGYGFAGAWIHDPLLRATDGIDVAGVVTSSPERRELARSRHQGVRLFDKAGDAWAEEGFDVAIVATPNAYHVDLALAAFDAGLAVVVDKPVAPTAGEARHLVTEAERRGRSLSVFHNRRWDGDFLTVRELATGGRLGAIHRLVSRFDRWRPAAAPNWRDDAGGGGLLLDLGSHLVDQALQLFGPVDSVYAELATRSAGRRSDDDAFLALRHRDGTISHLHASALEGAPFTRFHVSGSDGAYVKHGVDIQEERLLTDEVPQPGVSGVEPRDRWGQLHRGDESEEIETAVGDWTAFYRGLVDHLSAGAPPPVSGAEALAVMEVLDAARASAADGVVVSLAAGSPDGAAADND